MESYSDEENNLFFEEKKVDIKLLTGVDDCLSLEQDPLEIPSGMIKTEVCDDQVVLTSNDAAMSNHTHLSASPPRVLIKEEVIIKDEVDFDGVEEEVQDNEAGISALSPVIKDVKEEEAPHSPHGNAPTSNKDSIDVSVNNNMLMCNCCNKEFVFRHLLKIHMWTHTTEKTLTCDHCQKSFTQRSTLIRHMFTHIGHKPYICDHCQKSFTQHGALKQHLLTHTGHKPFICNCCQKSFTRRSSLKQHILIHTGHKPHICDYCRKSFSQYINLKEHILTHTGHKPQICSHCQKSFTHRRTLRRHVLTHTDDKPYICDYCPKSFYDVSYLKRHMRICRKHCNI